jgi:hypothetical protein
MIILASYFSATNFLSLLGVLRSCLNRVICERKTQFKFFLSHGENLLKGELYRDPRVQALLSKFFGKGLQAILPVFDLKRGIVYPDVEEILGKPSGDGEFLAWLYNAGVLSRELYDRVVCCPICGSANVKPVIHVLIANPLTL